MVTGAIPTFGDDVTLDRGGRPAFRLPAVASGGGAAIVSTQFPAYGQPSRGGISVFRSVRQPSGVWSQSYAASAQQLQLATGLPEAWTPDFSTLLYLTDQPGTDKAISTDGRTITFRDNAETSDDGTQVKGDIYQRTDGGPARQVNVTTGGAPIPNAKLEQVSPDGSRVAFSADDGTGTGPRVYLRDGATTLEVDAAPQATTAPRTASKYVGGTPQYRTEADLRSVFFLTRDQLVPGDTNSYSDLYRRDEDGRGPELVSAGSGTDCPTPLPNSQLDTVTDGCDVAFAGATPDGKRVFFLSPERLAGAAAAQPGLPNLYVRDRGGPIRYVLSLQEGNGLELRPQYPRGSGSADVGRDGSFLAVTQRDPNTGAAYESIQVVRVDPSTLRATCISCGPNGETADFSFIGAGGAAEEPAHSSTADGAHVYFNTRARLVAADRNSAEDVYDYDVASGERTLVSTGTSPRDSLFAGASDDGTDVMFSTTESLVARDHNGPYRKIYDARRGGGEQAPTTAALPCGDACSRPAPAAPPFEPGDSARSGVSSGNVASARDVRLAVGGVSAARRRAFARTGRLVVTVRTSAAATVRVVARAKLGRSTATVAAGSARLRRSGTARVTLRLSRAARRALRDKRSLRVSVGASIPGGSATKRFVLSLTAGTSRKAGTR